MKVYIKSAQTKYDIKDDKELVELLDSFVGQDVWVRVNVTPRKFRGRESDILDSAHTMIIKLLSATDLSYKYYRLKNAYDSETGQVEHDQELSENQVYTTRKSSLRLVKPLRTYTTKQLFENQQSVPDWK